MRVEGKPECPKVVLNGRIFNIKREAMWDK